MNKLNIAVTTVALSSRVDLLKKYFPENTFNLNINVTGRRLTNHELILLMKDCDMAIVGLDVINENVLKHCSRLKLISKYGVGLDNINFEDCRNYNVLVKFSSGVNKRSVSELVLGYVLSYSRNIFKTSNNLKRNSWTKNGGFQFSEKKIGIIGLGNIGKDLVEIIRPFNCTILANDICDISLYCNQNKIVVSSKDQIFSECDIITIHTPLTTQTKNLICKDSIQKMKYRPLIINTSRGEIMNIEDVKWGLTHSLIGGLAIDVYPTEPFYDKDLFDFDNVICTPHIGGNSKEAVEAMGITSIMHILNELNDTI